MTQSRVEAIRKESEERRLNQRYYYYNRRNEIIKVRTRMAKLILDKQKKGDETKCDPANTVEAKEAYCEENFLNDEEKLQGIIFKN